MYTFKDGEAQNHEMDEWADQTCIAKLCMPQFKFWVNSAEDVNSKIADGVLGLANSNSTFPQ